MPPSGLGPDLKFREHNLLQMEEVNMPDMVRYSSRKDSVANSILSISTCQSDSHYSGLSPTFTQVTHHTMKDIAVDPGHLRVISSSVARTIAIFVDLCPAFQVMSPIVMETGQPFLSAQELVRCLPSDAQMIGITVPSLGNVSQTGL